MTGEYKSMPWIDGIVLQTLLKYLFFIMKEFKNMIIGPNYNIEYTW